jgi:hypothetical protein
LFSGSLLGGLCYLFGHCRRRDLLGALFLSWSLCNGFLPILRHILCRFLLTLRLRCARFGLGELLLWGWRCFGLFWLQFLRFLWFGLVVRFRGGLLLGVSLRGLLNRWRSCVLDLCFGVFLG